MQRKEICEYMIITYLKALAKKVKKIRILKTSQMNIDFIIKEHQLQEKMKMMKIYGPQDIAENIDDDICLVDYTNKEASNFYEFYRILSQENYDLGKNMSEFLVKFRKENEDVTKAINLIPQQMEDIYKFTEECVATFNCYFNFGKSSTEKLLQYCRPAVEKFIFNKIYQDLYECYCLKYEIENQIFSKNQNLIRTNKTPVEIMKVIEVRKCFIEENPKVLPYKSTIDCINKIEFEVSPKDKFETLMKASLELRNSVLDVTRGKVNIINYSMS
jgi:hypothetical protein